MIEMADSSNVLKRLSYSKFRSHFHLTEKDYLYIKNKGMDTIERHAYDFILKRLAFKDIPNDGKQTPMRGHPVFVAQHATATCCRGCLFKWYQIPRDRELRKDEIVLIVNVIMKWIFIEYQNWNK